MKKVLYPLAALVVVVALGFGVVKSLKNQEGVPPTESPGIQQTLNDEAGRSTQDNFIVLNLIGESVSNPFSFASSTNQVYWDTTLTGYPHEYGPTTTASFLIAGAEAVNLNIYYDALIADSFAHLDLYVSNDLGCNNASSTANTANWFPVPVKSTTTPELNPVPLILTTNSADHDILLDPGTAVAQSFSYSFPAEALNYNCARVVASNSSTTDASLLYVEASITR